MHFVHAGIIPESQCGCSGDTGTIDTIFTAIKLYKTCKKIDVVLYKAFVDVTKVFNTVSRNAICIKNNGNDWLSTQINSKVCKDQELKHSEPKSSPQNQNGK